MRKASKTYGHYLVNSAAHIFIKYADGDGPDFAFTFTPDEKTRIASKTMPNRDVFAVVRFVGSPAELGRSVTRDAFPQVILEATSGVPSRLVRRLVLSRRKPATKPKVAGLSVES